MQSYSFFSNTARRWHGFLLLSDIFSLKEVLGFKVVRGIVTLDGVFFYLSLFFSRKSMVFIKNNITFAGTYYQYYII